MVRTTVARDLYQYQFSAEAGELYGFNLYALVSEKEVLLIDTAYEGQASKVLADLSSNGHSLKHVLISHFHPDHTSGLEILPSVTVWGSDQYVTSFDRYYSPQEQQSLPVVQGLSESSVLEFGEFSLTFRYAPGHSPCSMYTLINDHCVHVGDNLMAADDGTPLLPWAELEYVGDHIRSLQLLQELHPSVLLLSHGPSITGELAISEAIDDRLRYLQAVWEAKGAITFEQATAHCSCRFLGERWHICSADQS